MARLGGMACGALAFLLAHLGGEARANPLDTFGFGSRSTALGGAVAADVADFSASYYNPAGLARARTLDVSLGYARADHFLRINGRDTEVDPVKGMVFGLVAPGTLASIPFAFGLALHLPDDRVSRVRALRQEQPRWELYDNRNQRLFLAANVAISPWEWLQIGAGVAFMSSTSGRFAIDGYANAFRPDQSQLRHEVDADLTAIRTPQGGVRIELAPDVALAVVYRGEFSLKLDLDAAVSANVSSLTHALYMLSTRSVNAFVPRQIVAAGSVEVSPAVRLNLDVTWLDWSAYVAPVARVDVMLDIPPPNGGWPLGITPPSAPGPTRVVAIDLRDRFVPRLGVEWRPVHKRKWVAALRAGYEFAASPIPPQVGATNYVDGDRHALSIGIGSRVIAPLRELTGDVRLDLHAQLHVIAGRTTEKADPADFIGDYVSGGHIWNVGGTLSVGF